MILDWLDNLESIFKKKIEKNRFIPFFSHLNKNFVDVKFIKKYNFITYPFLTFQSLICKNKSSQLFMEKLLMP